MKTGIIDVGGGLRGIYGAGVLDRCMEEGVRFDCCIGVSAGSANMSSYVAGQHGRNKPFYQDYSFRKEYMSVGNLVRKHSYLDLEYVYGALSNRGGENPLDYPALANAGTGVFHCSVSRMRRWQRNRGPMNLSGACRAFSGGRSCRSGWRRHRRP